MRPSREQLRLNMRIVAQHAGVSSATVSRVLNGSGPVKEETAKHVRRILEELKFIPNPIATTLKYGRSNTYGVIIPDLTNPFFPEFLFNFEEVLVENDYELLIASTQSSEAKLINSVRRMLMRQVDGVVLMASELETRAIEPLLDHKIPIVTVDRRRAQEGVADVAIDFEVGYQQAVEHLHKLGHRRIGFLGGSEGIRTSEIRLKAFQKGLQGAGLTYEPTFVRAGNYRVNGGDAAMNWLLEQSSRPTAVITANDLTAFGALRALHARGIGVPSEMSVIGFDGIQLSNAVYPALTTIEVAPQELARACARALAQVKSNIAVRGPRLNVRSELIVRESTAAAPRRRSQRQR